MTIAFRSGFVTVYVGPGKQEYTAHKEVLTEIKFFAACLDSGFRESKENEMSLPEEEPEIFEKILEYLYQDKIEAEQFTSTEVSNAEDSRQETDTTMLMARVRVWVAADEYCREPYQNHIMDYFAALCVKRVPTPKITPELTE